MNQSDTHKLQRIIDMGDKLYRYIDSNEVSEKQVLKDYEIQWTITTPLFNIGELTHNISAELKTQYTNIPWAKVSGLRHRLVHDYEGTNWDIVTNVIFRELPLFLQQVRDLLDER